MLKTVSFSKIHITKLTKKAGISRKTFYDNYIDIYDLLDETIDDALSLMHDKTGKDYAAMYHAMWKTLVKNDIDAFAALDLNVLPPPSRLSDYPKYRPLFCDDSIYFIILKRIIAWEKKPFTEALRDESDLDAVSAENILYFIIAGTLIVNRRLGCEKTREWYVQQFNLMRFIMSGYYNV